MKKILVLIYVSLAILIAGCSSIPMASVDTDSQAKAFVVKSDRSTIYIYRDELFGAAIQMPVSINGKSLGKTGSKTYFSLDVPPGKYTILSSAENESTFVLQTEAGKNYFIWQEVKMGLLYARNILQMVSDDRGKAGVNQCKLIETKESF